MLNKLCVRLVKPPVIRHRVERILLLSTGPILEVVPVVAVVVTVVMIVAIVVVVNEKEHAIQDVISSSVINGSVISANSVKDQRRAVETTIGMVDEEISQQTSQ